MNEKIPICCGLPMVYYEVFGIRIYHCDHKSHHPVIYVNLYTGQKVSGDELNVHRQEPLDEDW